ncbi:hypothetical protein ILP92_11815 [Maribius pontilimi]|uniref:Protein ImuA n=1 Tax=Palleronia pontilimi TaxID=1964209 RepID=A0A934IAF6_9RHOB|nr:hypothetical protein [Palleronia pontilimi]MBJ3763433.1 hypothetical protein [Palleronia pontilimi]
MNALPAHLLTRGPHRPDAAPGVAIAGDLRLALGRVHELCGLSRRMLALAIAARMTGPVFWIAPARANVAPNPDGFAAWLDPGRLVYVHVGHDRDVLWCAEETLRSGAVPLMIADLPGPPSLTAVRRMHLAAEAGAAQAGAPPLGLLMTPEGGAPGVETRWKMTPDFTDGPAWLLDRQRARTAPPLVRRLSAACLLGNAPLAS